MKEPKNQRFAHALAPVFLPEFNLSVSWAMCRNPACGNFGRLYEGGPLGNRKSVTDGRYRVQPNKSSASISCNRCRQSFTLKSNRAIRPLARYFLKLSLPFAACPNPDCSNHGLNVFENYFPTGDPAAKGRVRAYRRQDEHQVACRKCGTKFRFGEALHLERSRGMRAVVKEVIQGIREKRSVSDTIERTQISIGSYYSYLQRASARLRDWHSWRNAQLLHEKFRGWEGPVRIYTDVIQVSLERKSESARHTNLNLIVTVVKLEGTQYVLAVHPGFLPKSLSPELDALAHRLDTPRYLDEWDCLQYGFGSRHHDSVQHMMRSLPDLGRQGFFSTASYAELAHFLVVRKMLSRFRKVYHHMDGAVSLYSAALTAWADDIRRGRVEIALFQKKGSYRKRKKVGAMTEEESNPWRGKKKDELLDAEWNAMQARIAEQAESGGLSLDGGAPDRRAWAQIFRKAFKGGHSKGGWAWLRFPPDSAKYRNCRTLWLTWNPDKSYADHGRDLLMESTVKPVDSEGNVIRSHARGAQRGKGRAEPGRSYRDAYAEPLVVLQEVWIVVLWRNYGVRIKTRRKVTPARPMRLMRPKEKVPDLAKLAWDFRLGLKEARRISKWVTR